MEHGPREEQQPDQAMTGEEVLPVEVPEWEHRDDRQLAGAVAGPSSQDSGPAAEKDWPPEDGWSSDQKGD